jgi:proteasome lid subunit RPN8/RPN11
MEVRLTAEHLREIEAQGEQAYPDEGGGFLLGAISGDRFEVRQIMRLPNEWSEEARRNRFRLTERTALKAELAAMEQGLGVIGVFHSHPNHPAEPSQWDLAWATWPNFSFLITSVAEGRAVSTRAWRLASDRASYEEDSITVIQHEGWIGD